MLNIINPLFVNLVRLTRRCFFLLAPVGVLILLALPTGIAHAGPVNPNPVILTQPDGTTITVSPFGDEFYSGYEYKCYTILRDEKSDYWVYAEQGIGGAISTWKIEGWH